MPEGTLLGSRFSGGVQARPANYDPEWVAELFVDVPCSQAQADLFHSFLRSMVGRPYDAAAIEEMAEGELSGQAMGWDQSGGRICSALIQEALIAAGIVVGSAATLRLTTPRDVFCQVAALAKVGEPEKPLPRAA